MFGPSSLAIKTAQLSGTLLAVTMFDTLTPFGKEVVLSVVFRASRKSPNERSEAAQSVEGQVVRSAKLVPAGPRNTGTLSGLLI